MEDVATQRGGLVFVYNMYGSKYANFDYDLSQKMLTLLKGKQLLWYIYVLSGFVTTTVYGDTTLKDRDAILKAFKRIARNIHDHHHHGHGHGEHGHHDKGGVDLLDFFQQVGVRLTDGKDREGADDLGNGKHMLQMAFILDMV